MNHDNYTSHSTPQSNWSDFNDTQALVRMVIKPGGHDDTAMGWTGGYATASDETGAVFLSCEFVLLSGAFAKRKVWSNVGLHSNKGPTWGQMGRSFIKAVLNSSRNIHPHDNSPEAVQARQIRGFAHLDGVEFAASIGVENDTKGELRNLIRLVIEPDNKAYAELMALKHPRDGGSGVAAGAPVAVMPAASHPPRVANTSINTSTTQGPPSWAQ
jgi:hypothetical protein